MELLSEQKVAFPRHILALIVVGLLAVLTAVGFTTYNSGRKMAAKQAHEVAQLADYKSLSVKAEALSEAYRHIVGADDQLVQTRAAQKGLRYSNWPQQTRMGYSTLLVDTRNRKTNYNQLAGEYNQTMADRAYPFTAATGLPVGAGKALPRSFDLFTVESIDAVHKATLTRANAVRRHHRVRRHLAAVIPKKKTARRHHAG